MVGDWLLLLAVSVCCLHRWFISQSATAVIATVVAVVVGAIVVAVVIAIAVVVAAVAVAVIAAVAVLLLLVLSLLFLLLLWSCYLVNGARSYQSIDMFAAVDCIWLHSCPVTVVAVVC